MAKGKKRAKIFETRFFGLLIGLFIFLLFVLIKNNFILFDRLETQMLDTLFDLKTPSIDELQNEGMQTSYTDLHVNDDIQIIGIDDRSLAEYGRWPFPRYREADLVNAFTFMRRGDIYRENSLFLDIFFSEPAEDGTNDAKLVNAIRNNGNVFLESVLKEWAYADDNAQRENFKRQKALYDGPWGKIHRISGDWQNMLSTYGVQANLEPYARAAYGYGHANFNEDYDKFYRKQQLVAKSSELIGEYKFVYPVPVDDAGEYLNENVSVDESMFERLEWRDKNGKYNTVEMPLTDASLSRLHKKLKQEGLLKEVIDPSVVDEQGNTKVVESYYVIRKYVDTFVPSITLSLALKYLHRTLDDITIELGKYIIIPNPMTVRPKKVFVDETQQEIIPPEQQIRSPEELELVPYEITLKKPIYPTQEQVESGEYKEGQIIEPAKTLVMKEVRIPIDEEGRMLINFMGPPSSADPQQYQTFKVRSFSSYADRPMGSNILNDLNKIIMVGPFAQGMAADQKPTPLGLMYGVEIHANALNTILMNQFIYNVPMWVDILVLFALVMLISVFTSRFSTVISLVLTIVLSLAFFLFVIIFFENTANIVNFWTPAVAMLFSFLSIVVYRVMTEERDKWRIKSMFGKYVNPKVVDQILENPPELGGVDKNLTVFFSDIRGFTTLSESMTPQDLVNHLNVYLTAMTDIILEYDGTLDKYEGDAIMCFWGAPVDQADHALRACKAALKQLIALEELNRQWPPEKRINIGIGLNSGIMTVGNMGSIGRMDYTIMGDQVNLGARLEGTNKTYITRIIISEYTYGMVKDHVIVRELDNIRVKGKNKPVLIYELIDILED
ncbi:MAG: CHASE2 domain-containing protein [Spirochaetales bacterium]|nr:CHASE2 domain-containing protein [Spirochaetales bacterium]